MFSEYTNFMINLILKEIDIKIANCIAIQLKENIMF